jgi:nitrous oxidase accessory protein NosD
VRPFLALVPVAAALALWLGGAPAHAETTGCTTIASLPATLSAPGHYCLASNLSVTGTGATAITVSAPNVVLDCNDHRLVAATANNSGDGVWLEATAIGTVVRDCRIDGFGYGVASAYSASPEPRAAHLVGNRITRAGLAGIFLYGSGHLVEGNHVSNGQRLGDGSVTGIYLDNAGGDRADGNIVRGNIVADFRPDRSATAGLNLSVGISLGYQQGAIVEDNTLEGLYGRTGGGVYGISAYQSSNLVLRDNRVLAPPPAAAPFDGGNWYGIFLQGTAEELASNHCVDNLVGHYLTNFSGCGTTSANTGF